MKPRKRVEIFKRTDNPDKNLSDFIAYFSPDFDLLGSHFSPSGLTVAKQTIANLIEKASPLAPTRWRLRSAVRMVNSVRRHQLNIPIGRFQSICMVFRLDMCGPQGRRLCRRRSTFLWPLEHTD